MRQLQTKNNLSILPGLLAELDMFCKFTQENENAGTFVYDRTKVANEAIALWLQTEAIGVLQRITRISQPEIQQVTETVVTHRVLEFPCLSKN